MNVDLSTFLVQDVIIHFIPKAAKANKESASPELAEVPVTLDATKREFFRNRIVKSLGSHELDVVYDPDATASPVPSLVVQFFKSNAADFVSISQDLAENLFAEQGGRSSEGWLAVVHGTIASGKTQGKCLVILKMEVEQGVRVERTTKGGKATFSISIDQMTLAESTKVFKAALFPRCSSLNKLEGRASDNQIGQNFGEEIAQFFLRYLGCTFRSNADRSTAEWYETAQTEFNNIEDPDKKTRYSLALMAELGKNSDTIDTKKFAKENLDPEDRDGFVNTFRLEDESVPIVPKETNLVGTLLRRYTVEFDNGLRLSGPPEVLDAALVAKDGETIVKANIRSLGRGSGRKALRQQPPDAG